jgi:hypothetical protein
MKSEIDPIILLVVSFQLSQNLYSVGRKTCWIHTMRMSLTDFNGGNWFSILYFYVSASLSCEKYVFRREKNIPNLPDKRLSYFLISEPESRFHHLIIFSFELYKYSTSIRRTTSQIKRNPMAFNGFSQETISSISNWIFLKSNRLKNWIRWGKKHTDFPRSELSTWDL